MATCQYPNCVGPSTHAVYYHRYRRRWSARAGHPSPRPRKYPVCYCRWHSTVLATQCNAQGITP